MFWPNLYSARLSCIYFTLIDRLLWLRDEPLENLWGRTGEVQKKYSRKGKLNEKKNSCTAINPKKYSCYGLKKIHTRNLLVGPNWNGPFHLMYQPKFPKFWGEWKVPLQLTKLVTWSNRDKDWKNANSFFQRRFCFCRRPRILTSLKLSTRTWLCVLHTLDSVQRKWAMTWGIKFIYKVSLHLRFGYTIPFRQCSPWKILSLVGVALVLISVLTLFFCILSDDLQNTAARLTEKNYIFSCIYYVHITTLRNTE